MKLPRRGEKGFTLVELLIVLAILAVLAAVVIPNVTGMFGRGAAQAYSTDVKTIQTGAATFYFDVHKGPATAGNDWDGSAPVGHYYPTYNGKVSGTTVASTSTTVDGNEVYLVTWGTGETHPGFAAIWMSLLVNPPEAITGTENTAPGTAHPLDGENGPYLNEFPKSCTKYEAHTSPVSASWGNGNPETPGGTYTWIIDKKGTVYGITYVSGVTGVDDGWYAGFNGTYP